MTPLWFYEGDAEFYMIETSEREKAFDYVYQLVRDNELPPLMEGTGPSSQAEYTLAPYYIGYTFFIWMDEQYGIEMHRRIMDALATNMPFLDAIEEAFGMSYASAFGFAFLSLRPSAVYGRKSCSNEAR